MLVVAIWKSTTTGRHWLATLVLACGWCGHRGEADHVACHDRFSFSFSSSSVGDLHLKFPGVLWIARKITGLTLPFISFPPTHGLSFHYFSFLIKTPIKEWELNTSWFNILLKTGSWARGARTEWRTQLASWARRCRVPYQHATLPCFSPSGEQ